METVAERYTKWRQDVEPEIAAKRKPEVVLGTLGLGELEYATPKFSGGPRKSWRRGEIKRYLKK